MREISREEAAQIRTAVLEERRRVARDLHDGVAQELAFIASQTQWFMRQPDDPQPLGQILDAVERALDESRGAIAALSRPMDEPLDLALGHAALDVANRVGARLHLDLDEGVEVPARLARGAAADRARGGRQRRPPRPRAHGQRSSCATATAIWLRVTDDGERLRPRRSALEPELRAHEHARAHRVARRHASVISSTPGEGTTVEVQLP